MDLHFNASNHIELYNGLYLISPDMIEELISRGQQLDAVHFTFEVGLVDKFPPVPLLKAFLRDAKKIAATILEDPNNAGRAMVPLSSFYCCTSMIESYPSVFDSGVTSLIVHLLCCLGPAYLIFLGLYNTFSYYDVGWKRMYTKYGSTYEMRNR